MTAPDIDVCAAIIRRGAHILLATRPHGSHLAGKWEFPGGKVASGETLEECIRREVHEELGLTVLTAVHAGTVRHHYPRKTVLLHFMECSVNPDETPVGHEGQQVQWVHRERLDEVDLAPADRAFVEARQSGENG